MTQNFKREQHRMSDTRFYIIWKSINRRCYGKNNQDYKDYGERGIRSVWNKSFISFKDDMYESYLEHTKLHGEKNTLIDRIDVNGNYCKENCKWSTQLEQANNKRNTMFYEYQGIKKSVRDWAREKGFKYETLRRRILKGCTENNLFSPLKRNKYI